MTKAELRNVFLEKRKLLSAETVAKLSRSIAGTFFASFDLSRVKALHIYIAIAKFNEIDTSLFVEKVWSEFPQMRTIAPRLNKETGQLQSVVFNVKSKLSENSWGIGEPDGVELVDPKNVDMVIVPLLCFDEQGNRVGYGKGYYDRFLAQCRPDCVKVGLSFFPPVGHIDNINEFDISLDRCVTPEQIFDFKK